MIVRSILAGFLSRRPVVAPRPYAKIAPCCHGLPMPISRDRDALNTAEKTPACWLLGGVGVCIGAGRLAGLLLIAVCCRCCQVSSTHWRSMLLARFWHQVLFSTRSSGGQSPCQRRLRSRYAVSDHLAHLTS